MKRFSLTFKQKVVVLVSVFGVLLVLLISFLSIRWHSEQMVLQTVNQTQQIIEQLGSNIDNYIDELFRLTLSPYYNDEVMKELERTARSPEKKLEKKRKIESFLSSVMILPRDEILRVYILTDKNRYSYSRTPYEMKDYWDYENTDWYLDSLQSSKPVFIPIHSEKVFGNKGTAIVSIARRIRSKEDNRKVLGVIKVDADYSVIKSLGDKISFEYHGGLFMLNENGEILYQNSNIHDMDISKELPQILQGNTHYTGENGQRYLYNTTLLESSGIRIVTLNSYSDIVKATLRNVAKAIIWVAFIFIAAYGLLLLLLQKFFHPLYQIVDAMKQVQSGDLTAQVNIKQKDEIGYLADSFNSMTFHLENVMKKNADLLTEVYESNYLYKASQYEALCNQIKPHFIHNTLNTISLLVKCGEYQKSVSCIEDLSLFLRGVMQADKEIPLEIEVQLAKSYLAICQNRYGERLQYDLHIDANCLKNLVPALTIQPIVENAVKHGCEKNSKTIMISLTAYVDEQNLLHIRIQDNGEGISTDALTSLTNQLITDDWNNSASKASLSSGGIGLVNVHRRLRLKYGMDAGIKLQSDANGTTVDIIYNKWR